jgi:hypothetical protein
MIEVDYFEAQMLADKLVEIAHGLSSNLGRRHEAAHTEVDKNAAFDDLGYRRLDHFVTIVRLDDLLPRLKRASATLGEKERSVELVDAMYHHFDGIADSQNLGVDCERKLAKWKDAFGLTADVDEHFVLVFLDDRAGEHLTFVQDFERFFVEALLER